MDSVLSVMVSGLEEELKSRMEGNEIYASRGAFPSPAIDADFLKKASREIDSSNRKK